MAEKRAVARPQTAKMAPLWDRLEAQINWYDQKAAASQRAYKVTKATIIVLALAIPVIAEYAHFESFERAPAFLVAICAGGILLLEGLLHINKWHENWIPARPARAYVTSSISSSRRRGLTPSSSRRRRKWRLPSAPARW